MSTERNYASGGESTTPSTTNGLTTASTTVTADERPRYSSRIISLSKPLSDHLSTASSTEQCRRLIRDWFLAFLQSQTQEMDEFYKADSVCLFELLDDFLGDLALSQKGGKQCTE